MSALAHGIEAAGIATTTIGLIRPHMEAARPPRGLWVPFQLGRPLGEPEDKLFQRRVLIQALRLLERTNGTPVILEDFPDDAPSSADRAGWQPTGDLAELLTPRARPPAGDVKRWGHELNNELTKVLPYWRKATARFGRTNVGLSGLSWIDWAPFAAPFLAGTVPPSPVPHLTAALAVRHLADDLKAMYAEAIQAEGDQPSSRQIAAWFWGTGAGTGTLAADFLRGLRTATATSSDNGFTTFGGRFLVPGHRTCDERPTDAADGSVVRGRRPEPRSVSRLPSLSP